MDRLALLEKWKDPVKVLDHGHVRLVDVMGCDDSIVQAARVSYGVGTTTVHEDRGLIRYLMRHRHTTPFEMCEIKLHCKMPIFIARQWVRHRTASLNEMSGRYSELPAEFYVPEIEQICSQSKKNKQGRAEPLPEDSALMFQSEMREAMTAGFDLYHEFLADGVDMARETARIGLPLSTYTEWYWKIDLHNLCHFLSLRIDSHAQWEIQQYGNAIASMVQDWVPHAWDAFVDYRLDAVTLTSPEIAVLQQMMYSMGLPQEEFIFDHLTRHAMASSLSKREKDEFCGKLKKIFSEARRGR